MSPVLQVLTLLTGLLFAVSLSTGIYGFLWGSRLGEEALAGIKQPDSSGSSVLRGETPSPSPSAAVSPAASPTAAPTPAPFLSEADIIQKVKAQTTDQSRSTPTPQASGKGTASPSPQTSPSPTATLAPGFPYTADNQGVTLAVLGVDQDSDQSLKLRVSLRNEGKDLVRFLYSFLTITDNQGRALGCSVEGLPSELPALSDTFTGDIKISRINWEGLKSINVLLADYPDQAVKLNIENIPVPVKNNNN